MASMSSVSDVVMSEIVMSRRSFAFIGSKPSKVVIVASSHIVWTITSEPADGPLFVRHVHMTVMAEHFQIRLMMGARLAPRSTGERHNVIHL